MCVKTLLIVEVVAAHFMVEGVVGETSYLDLDLLFIFWGKYGHVVVNCWHRFD